MEAAFGRIAAVANDDDVSDFGGAENLVATASDAIGGLDILVNDAGVIRDKMIVSMSEDDSSPPSRARATGCGPTRRP